MAQQPVEERRGANALRSHDSDWKSGTGAFLRRASSIAKRPGTNQSVLGRTGRAGKASWRIRQRLTVILTIVAIPFFAGCRKEIAEYAPTYQSRSPATATETPEYGLGVFPLHGPVHLYEVFQPVVDLINERAKGFSVHLESSRDYPVYEAKVFQKRFDLAVINPYQAIVAEKIGYRIFGKMGDNGHFRGIIVVRRDSGIQKTQDLRGKTICFPAATAMAGTLMTKELLACNGLNPETEAQSMYVGSHDSVLMNVYLGLAAAGGTWPPAWESTIRDRPEIAKALEVKWQSKPLPSLALVIREEIPETHRKVIAEVLFGLRDSEVGRRILARMEIPCFEPADSATYAPARKFLDDYAKRFGKLPELEGAPK